MLKLTGAGLVVLSCGFFGLILSHLYQARPVQLKALISGLKLLETEIVYASTPLPQALARTGEQLGGVAGLLFLEAAALLREEPGLPAVEAWGEGLEKLKEQSALHLEDLDILKTLGQGLGASGREDQVKNLELAREHLKRQLVLAEEAAQRQGKMWRTLGFLLGITLVLLMY
ncbi:stage III sporulation protein AB [Thermanaeromonas toyohensis ToBE]|uniref:Stage III sporulation protein AB n=1 Tax=Thermanaeromonas toyohensis ToBE TaxID=698762 RepID=A0A1W1VYY2_9FIRM|nr:stage III sporulation protein SpoIIIAB [Thermanaeromonas toyohensis]SMB98592.1 stage III sporulation protein AB [Thermanaeromonas toyohensis ToBE]